MSNPVPDSAHQQIDSSNGRGGFVGGVSYKDLESSLSTPYKSSSRSSLSVARNTSIASFRTLSIHYLNMTIYWSTVTISNQTRSVLKAGPAIVTFGTYSIDPTSIPPGQSKTFVVAPDSDGKHLHAHKDNQYTPGHWHRGGISCQRVCGGCSLHFSGCRRPIRGWCGILL